MWPFKKKPVPPVIPPYRPPPVRTVVKPESGIEVQEHDTSQMTATGIHKAWKRLSDKDK